MCPECGKPMIVFEWRGVEIDRCVSCGGTWLDAGELEMIASQAGARSGKLSEALRRGRARPARRGAGPTGKRRCPRCRARLRAATVGERRPVELDRCPRGHGLWFDQGELEATVGQYEEGEEGAVARFFAELYCNEFDNQKKGE